MYKYKTKKREKYYDEVMHYHFQLGYGEDRISNIIPVGHSTIHRWITNFVTEHKGEIVMKTNKRTGLDSFASIKSIDIKEIDNLPLDEQIRHLKTALLKAEMRADLNDEIINVAEDKFKIQIRKKAGAKR